MFSSPIEPAVEVTIPEPRESSRFVRMLRLACAVVLVLCAASAGARLALSGSRYPSLFILEFSQVVVVLATLRWLQQRRPQNRVLVVALAVSAVVYMTSAAFGAISGDTVTSALVFSAFALATGAMLPWGVQPQLLTVSVAGLVLLAQILMFSEYDLTQGYQAASLSATAVAMLASVVMVWQVENYRAQSSTHQSLWMEADRALRKLQSDIERRVSERTGELEAANRDLESFSYSVSHDLRGPLRAVTGFTQALLDDYGGQLDPKAVDLVQRLAAATQRMGNLVDALLEVAHVNHHELKQEPIDVAAVAGGIIADLKAASPGRSVAVSIAEGMTTNADPRLVGVLLSNLIGNAWKFTGHEPLPRIEVGEIREGGQSIYFVRDNGVGFSSAAASEMFTAFRRFHAGFEGSGIGLSIAARVVARHGGRIWAESRAGEGATFFFTLSEDAPADPAAVPYRPAPALT